MSTRSQIQVTQEGLWPSKVTMYHHCDGYPTNIGAIVRDKYIELAEGSSQWEMGRAGKVASHLCAADPGQFEPEEGHERHGDIEWYYVLHVVNEQGGSMAENPSWSLDIEKVRSGKKWLSLNMKKLTDEMLHDIEHDGEED